MLLEAFKIAKSVFPFIKEMYLWRDGAEEGKPITRENLVRRKIAVFAMIGSMIFNYLVVSMLMDSYKKVDSLNEDIAKLKEQVTVLTSANKQCHDSTRLAAALSEALGEACKKNKDLPPSSVDKKQEKSP